MSKELKKKQETKKKKKKKKEKKKFLNSEDKQYNKNSVILTVIESYSLVINKILQIFSSQLTDQYQLSFDALKEKGNSL